MAKMQALLNSSWSFVKIDKLVSKLIWKIAQQSWKEQESTQVNFLIYYKDSNQDNTSKNTWTGLSPEKLMFLYYNCQLVGFLFNKRAKITQRRKKQSLQQMVLWQLYIHMQNNGVRLLFKGRR